MKQICERSCRKNIYSSMTFWSHICLLQQKLSQLQVTKTTRPKCPCLLDPCATYIAQEVNLLAGNVIGINWQALTVAHPANRALLVCNNLACDRGSTMHLIVQRMKLACMVCVHCWYCVMCVPYIRKKELQKPVVITQVISLYT